MFPLDCQKVNHSGTRKSLGLLPDGSNVLETGRRAEPTPRLEQHPIKQNPKGFA